LSKDIARRGISGNIPRCFEREAKTTRNRKNKKLCSVTLSSLYIFSAGQQKYDDGNAQFDNVGDETGEQSEANQPSGGQRVAQPKLQSVRHLTFSKKPILM